MLSSRVGDGGWLFGEGSVVSQESPEDVDAAAGESDNGLGVGTAVLALLEVVVPVRTGPHHGGLRGQVEHMPQRSAVAAGLVQVARASAGVVRDRHESGSGSEVTGARERSQVTGGGQQRRAEERAEPGHRDDDGGLWVELEGGGDLGVDVLDPGAEGQDAAGEFGDDPGGDLLSRQGEVLGARRR